jgi:probable H4MPT-linked C1 transfer pathway protein
LPRVIGWDIGGANVKAAFLAIEDGAVKSGRAVRRYFELWRDRAGLRPLLQEMREGLGAADAMALTMTGELADVFTDKREGVAFIIRAAREAAVGMPLYGVDLDGCLVSLDAAEVDHAAFAATNWIAEALVLAESVPNCLMADIGSTTTDLIPIVAGRVAAKGKRDIDRLAWGELIYTGVLRTPVPAIVSQIPLRGMISRLSSEYFAVAADVYRVLGRLGSEDYACSTPDGRGTSREEALGRLARVACEDAAGLTDAEITAMAAYIAERQAQQITEGMFQVLSGIDGNPRLPIVPVGIGAFLGVACGRRLNLQICEPPSLAESGSPTLSPCVAAAYLLGRSLIR